MKKVFYVLGGLVVLYFVVALFAKSNVTVERSQLIKASHTDAMKALGDFQHFHNYWSPWTEIEPDMKASFDGTPGTVGHKYLWEGKKDSVGVGEMIIDSTTENNIFQTVHFIKPMESIVKSYFTTESIGDSTKITWGMNFSFAFFMRPIMLFMDFDKMLGTSLEYGLQRLKSKLESKDTVYRGYNVQLVDFEERHYAGIRKTQKFADLGSFFSGNFEKIPASLAKSNVAPAGPMASMYFFWDEKNGVTDCAALMQVADSKSVDGLEIISVKPGKAVKVAYFGAPDKSMEAYYAIDDYLKANNLKDTMALEEYITDKTKEPDTTKWLTNIYFILK